MSTGFIWVPVGLYLLGWVLEFAEYWRGSRGGRQWGAGLIAVGWGAHTIFLFAQLWEAPPTMSATLVGVAWLSIVVYFLVLRRARDAVFGFVFPPFAVSVLLVAALTGNDPLLFSPGAASATLTRNVLITHITSVLAGLLLFALGCLFSIAYLYQERRIKLKAPGLQGTRLPSLGALDHLNHKATILGFFFLSAGILLGMLVSGTAGPPVDVLSLRRAIPLGTWVVYALFLLQHSVQGRRGRFGALWSIFGFSVVATALVFELFVLAGRH